MSIISKPNLLSCFKQKILPYYADDDPSINSLLDLLSQAFDETVEYDQPPAPKEPEIVNKASRKRTAPAKETMDIDAQPVSSEKAFVDFDDVPVAAKPPQDQHQVSSKPMGDAPEDPEEDDEDEAEEPKKKKRRVPPKQRTKTLFDPAAAWTNKLKEWLQEEESKRPTRKLHVNVTETNVHSIATLEDAKDICRRIEEQHECAKLIEKYSFFLEGAFVFRIKTLYPKNFGRILDDLGFPDKVALEREWFYEMIKAFPVLIFFFSTYTDGVRNKTRVHKLARDSKYGLLLQQTSQRIEFDVAPRLINIEADTTHLYKRINFVPESDSEQASTPAKALPTPQPKKKVIHDDEASTSTDTSATRKIDNLSI